MDTAPPKPEPKPEREITDRGRFCAWYALDRAHEHAPHAAGVFQIRQPRGLSLYPRGKSAMVLYGHASDLATALVGLRARMAREPIPERDATPSDGWLCRHQVVADHDAAHALYDQLVQRFQVRFGALPRLHPGGVVTDAC